MSVWGEVGGKWDENLGGEDGRNGLKTYSRSVSESKAARLILECKCKIKHSLTLLLSGKQLFYCTNVSVGWSDQFGTSEQFLRYVVLK